MKDSRIGFFTLSLRYQSVQDHDHDLRVKLSKSYKIYWHHNRARYLIRDLVQRQILIRRWKRHQSENICEELYPAYVESG
jgi:hypothetical protein